MARATPAKPPMSQPADPSSYTVVARRYRPQRFEDVVVHSWTAPMDYAATGLLGAAALHPSMARLGVAAPVVRDELHDRRLVALTAALLCAPLVVALGTVRGRGTDVLLLSVSSVIMVSLVMLRIRGLARERSRQESREREQESARRLAEERLRIARDLHDTLGHALVAIRVRAGVAARLGTREDPTAALGDVRTMALEALRDLHGTLRVVGGTEGTAPMRPSGDLAAVQGLVDRVRAGGLDVRLDVRLDGGLDGTVVPAGVGEAGIRIVQEALTNVLRHAGATTVRVGMGADEGVLVVQVDDDGAGGDGGDGVRRSGWGLRGMAERAAAVGGHLEAGPRRGGGWQVRARLPLSADAGERDG